MGRIYSATFEDVAETTAADFFELNAPSDAVVEILELHLSQTSLAGDTNEEQLSVQIKSGATTSGSGGTTVTAVPRELGDAAFGGTCEANNSTIASGGTIVTHFATTWNNRVALNVIFPPEGRIILSPSARGTVELGETPTALTISGTLVFREIGG